MTTTAVRVQSNVAEAELLLCIPHLRAYARSLTKDRDRASDLEQETVVKALKAAHQFRPGTNLKHWMMTIMRNQFYSELRRNRRPIQTFNDASEIVPAVAPSQELSLELFDFRRAFWQLDDHYRRALILVGAGGLSYETAARVAACPTGTMKSRVHRARRELQHVLAQGSLGVIRPGTPATARYVNDVLAGADQVTVAASRVPDGPAATPVCGVTPFPAQQRPSDPLTIAWPSEYRLAS